MKRKKIFLIIAIFVLVYLTVSLLFTENFPQCNNTGGSFGAQTECTCLGLEIYTERDAQVDAYDISHCAGLVLSRKTYTIEPNFLKN